MQTMKTFNMLEFVLLDSWFKIIIKAIHWILFEKLIECFDWLMYAYLGGSVFELMWVKKVTVTKKKNYAAHQSDRWLWLNIYRYKIYLEFSCSWLWFSFLNVGKNFSLEIRFLKPCLNMNFFCKHYLFFINHPKMGM